MSAITPSSTGTAGRSSRSTSRPLWQVGVITAVVAAVAITLVQAIVQAAGLSLEFTPDETLPIGGAVPPVLLSVAIGTILASLLVRRAKKPSSTFVVTASVLTVLSCVTPFVVEAPASTRVALIVAHFLVAAIVIPPLARNIARHAR